MISQSNFYSSLLPTLPPCLPPSVPPFIGMLGIISGPECTTAELFPHSETHIAFCSGNSWLSLLDSDHCSPFSKNLFTHPLQFRSYLLPHGSHLSWFPNWRFGVWCTLLRGESGLLTGTSPQKCVPRVCLSSPSETHQQSVSKSESWVPSWSCKPQCVVQCKWVFSAVLMSTENIMIPCSISLPLFFSV